MYNIYTKDIEFVYYSFRSMIGRTYWGGLCGKQR